MSLVSLKYARERRRRRYPTKRVPQDKCQLGYLFPLLAELQQGRLARVLIKQIGDVLQCPSIVLRDGRIQRALLRVALRQGIDAIVSASQAAVILLLGHIHSTLSSGLDVVLVRCLLVHPGRVRLGILVVAIYVRVGHHLVGGGSA